MMMILSVQVAREFQGEQEDQRSVRVQRCTFIREFMYSGVSPLSAFQVINITSSFNLASTGNQSVP